jgi:hypothetical protein
MEMGFWFDTSGYLLYAFDLMNRTLLAWLVRMRLKQKYNSFLFVAEMMKFYTFTASI